jgi:hypothetical protein
MLRAFIFFSLFVVPLFVHAEAFNVTIEPREKDANGTAHYRLWIPGIMSRRYAGLSSVNTVVVPVHANWDSNTPTTRNGGHSQKMGLCFARVTVVGSSRRLQHLDDPARRVGIIILSVPSTILQTPRTIQKSNISRGACGDIRVEPCGFVT